MKEKLLDYGTQIMVGILFLTVSFFFWIRPSYTWDETVIIEHRNDGWIFLDEIRSVSLALPWTWFYPPTHNLFFAAILDPKGGEYQEIFREKNLLAVQGKRVFYNSQKIFNRTSYEEYFYIYDCNKNRYVSIDGIEDLEDIPDIINSRDHFKEDPKYAPIICQNDESTEDIDEFLKQFD
jgi:hypothetical protein